MAGDRLCSTGHPMIPTVCVAPPTRDSAEAHIDVVVVLGERSGESMVPVLAAQHVVEELGVGRLQRRPKRLLARTRDRCRRQTRVDPGVVRACRTPGRRTTALHPAWDRRTGAWRRSPAPSRSSDGCRSRRRSAAGPCRPAPPLRSSTRSSRARTGSRPAAPSGRRGAPRPPYRTDRGAASRRGEPSALPRRTRSSSGRGTPPASPSPPAGREAGRSDRSAPPSGTASPRAPDPRAHAPRSA